VESVGRIEAIIGEVSVIAASISAAVEEQGSATVEIARNVTRTAVATNEMASRIAELSAEAEGTDKRAVDVRNNTTDLAGAVEDLRRAVVRAVRTSTTEADRRGSPRTPVDLPCRVQLGGGPEQTARLVDLSEGGACIADAPPMAEGTTGRLLLDAMGAPLPFTVRQVEHGLHHVSLRLDTVQAGRLAAMLGRVEGRRVA
jgi:hypothetical protein